MVSLPTHATKASQMLDFTLSVTLFSLYQSNNGNCPLRETRGACEYRSCGARWTLALRSFFCPRQLGERKRQFLQFDDEELPVGPNSYCTFIFSWLPRHDASDIDLLCHWLQPATPSRITSFGGLQHFRQSAKPKDAGSATRCFDCAIERQCPYSAKKSM